MTPKEFKSLMVRNWGKLLVVPVITAISIYFFTSSKEKQYTSTTAIFTGITSSLRIAGDNNANEKVDYDVVFGNLLGIINSRDLRQEVALNLLATHLMLKNPDPAVLGKKNFDMLKVLLPDSARAKLVGNTFDETLANVTAAYKAGASNPVTQIINSSVPVYSLDALSKITVKQLNSSEIISLEYTSNDPAVSWSTLDTYNKVFFKKHNHLSARQTESVVSYFDTATQNAYNRLQQAEQKLFNFHQANNIIDYDQQATATSTEKTSTLEKYKDLQMQYAGAFSTLKTAEQNLKNRGVSNLQSQEIIQLRDQLSDVTDQITALEMFGKTETGVDNTAKLARLKQQSDEISNKIKETIDTYYNNTHSSQGVPIQTMLDEYVKNTTWVQQLKSQLDLLDKQNKNIADEYSKLVPLGAEMRKIKREVEIAEQDYLAQVEGLKQSKLTQENRELESSQLKVLDPPNFPGSNSGKVLMMTLAGFIGALVFMMGGIVTKDLLDTSLKTPAIAAKMTGLPLIGVLPLKSEQKKNQLLTSKAEDYLSRQILLEFNKKPLLQNTYLIGLFSGHTGEGKSSICNAMSEKLNSLGVRTMVLYPKPHSQKLNSESNFATYSPSKGLNPQTSITELAGKQVLDYDIVLIEFPAVLEKTFPVSVLQQLDLAMLVIKSDRKWQKADIAVFGNIQTQAKASMQVVLNGANDEYVADFIGVQENSLKADEDTTIPATPIKQDVSKRKVLLNAD